MASVEEEGTIVVGIATTRVVINLERVAISQEKVDISQERVETHSIETTKKIQEQAPREELNNHLESSNATSMRTIMKMAGSRDPTTRGSTITIDPLMRRENTDPIISTASMITIIIKTSRKNNLRSLLLQLKI